MQHLDDDILELFKKAAEEYPLNAGNGNWNSIAEKLAAVAPYELKPKKSLLKIKGLLAVIIVLLASTVPAFVLHDTILVPVQFVNRAVTHAESFTTGEHTLPTNPATVAKNLITQPPVNNAFWSNQNEKRPVSAHQNGLGHGVLKDERNTPTNILTQAQTESNIEIQGDTGNNIEPFNDQQPLTTTNEENSAEPECSTEKPTALSANQAATAKKNTKERKIQTNKRWYVGITGGTEINKVSSAGTGSISLTGGLVTGVKLSNIISLETGLIYSRKNYSSTGKVFKLNKVGASMQGMVIKTIESQSSFLEIPLSVRLYVYQKKQSAFYIAPGITSYIMLQEKNDYNVIRNGSYENVKGFYTTNNYNIPAVVTLSAGYEKNIAPLINTSIAPYIHIPLRGVGVGSLPITSAGIRVTFTGSIK